MPYLFLAIAFTLNAIANILLKQGASHGLQLHGAPVTLIVQNWQLLLGMGLFALNIVFYFLALRALPLSVAYPVMVAMGFLIVNGFALFSLGESVSAVEIVGYIMIMIGLVLVVVRSA